MEAAGQALLDAPLESANNVGPLLSKLAELDSHEEVGCRCFSVAAILHIMPSGNSKSRWNALGRN